VFGLFNAQPLIDDESRQWLFAVYDWALREFGSDVFHRETILVRPDEQHFPGRADSLHGMAELVFGQVARHAGVSHWPIRLVPPQAWSNQPQPPLRLSGGLRGEQAMKMATEEAQPAILLSYEPGRVGNPEALIATYARTLAEVMATIAKTPPPGGRENWLQMTEVLSVFMGFGIMTANSAYESPKLGCGACRVPGSDRPSYLSRYDVSYALAIFCALKGIPAREVVRYLKAPLRGYFKKALREVRRDPAAMARLGKIDAPLSLS